MTFLYLVIAVSMFAVNVIMEYCTLTPRFTVRTHVAVRIVSVLVWIAVLVLLWRAGLGGSYVIRSLATFPVYLSCIFLFKETFAQKTYLYFFNYSSTAFIATVCIWAATYIFPARFKALGEGMLYIAVLLALVYPYFRRGRPRITRMLFLFKNCNPVYALYPLVSFILFAVLFPPVRVSTSLSWFLTLVLFLAMCVLTYVILFSHFTSVYDRLEAESLMAQTTRQLSLQTKYYEEIDRGMKAQSKILHDARHHLIVISTLASAGDISEISGYIDGLLPSFSGMSASHFCENRVLNATIGGYASLAAEKGISVTSDLDIPSSITINEYDLCAFLGNALENAIEACERISPDDELYTQRFISLESRADPGRLVFRIRNSFMRIPGQEDNDFSSSKGSGIGLKSMEAVAKKYHGAVSADRKGSVFVLSAVFSLREPSV